MPVLPLSRRTVLLAGSAGAAALAWQGQGFAAGAAHRKGEVAGVPIAQRPRLRWWWPGGAIRPEEVRREVADMAASGFGGFEIADVRDSVVVPMDPATLGWGSDNWVAGVEAAFDEADRLGLKADITIGAHWPTGMPGVTPNSPSASQELVHGAVTLAASAAFDGPLPAPEGPPAGLQPGLDVPEITPRLIALQAYRITGEGPGGTIMLDPATRTELSGKVTNGRLRWSAPAGGAWRLIAFWGRGTGQLQNLFDRNKKTSMLADPAPFVVDIFGKAGTQVCTEYWDEHLLPPRMKALAKRIGGSFFEDSLELKSAQHWSPDLLAEFETRRGYSLRDHLPLAVKPAFDPARAPFQPLPAPYGFAGVSRRRLLRDFNATLGEMYVDNRVIPVSDWAHTLGMKFRVQAIGGIVDSGSAAARADIPEGDNSCDMDGFRVLAAGASIGGRPILSDEAATFVGGNAHVADWRTLLMMVRRDYAAGVNQAVLHGYSYADAPGASWPGFSAFGRAIGEDWGPRSPHWAVASDMTGYLARLQAFLQAGPTVCDIAILTQTLGTHAEFADPGLAGAGYTYQFPTASLLMRDDAVLTDGKLFAKGPAYGALVLNGEEALEPKIAARLLELAGAGLPIFVVGEPPRRAVGLPASDDALVQDAMAKLIELSHVHAVADEAGLPQALAKAGIHPTLGFAEPEAMVGLTRRSDQGLHVYLLNDGTSAVRQTISVNTTARPWLVDCWTGKTRPAANYEVKDGRTNISFDMPVDGVVTLLFSDSMTAPALHAQAPGKALAYRGRKLVLNAQRAGSETIALSNGRSVTVDVPTIAAPAELASWQLTVESWEKGASVTAIAKRTIDAGTVAAGPWRALPALDGVSGIGHYLTSLDLPAGWSAKDGAMLDLVSIGGSARVIVNGRAPVPVDPFSLKADISSDLRPGKNTIEILVATNLNNRLMAEGIESDMFNDRPAAGDGPPPAPPPAPKVAFVPDEEPESPPSMAKGAAAPGTPRTAQDYGLLAAPVLRFYRQVPIG